MSPSQRMAPRFILAGALLGLLFYFVPVSEVANALRDVSPGYLLAGVFLQFLMRGVATLRMHVITANQGMALSHAKLFRILLITQYYALMLPGTMATGGATWLKYVQAGASKSAAIVAVMLNRGIGTLVMLVTGVAAWWLSRGPVQLGAMLALLLVCTALLLVALFGRVSPLPTPAAGAKEPLWRAWLRAVVNRLLLFQQVSPAGKLVVLASSLAFELIGALTLWCFARAVGLSLDLLTVLWMRAALQVIMMLPLHFAGLGLREASLVGMGTLVGVAAPLALAWSLVIFAGSLVVSAVGGLLEADAAARYFAGPRHFPLADGRRDSER